jgi:hypothetical protein
VKRFPEILLLMIFAFSATAFSSSNITYIAQNAVGGNTGADCADAHSAAWFNSASNWGSGSSQIGPGTTVHLCGTFTGTAGSTMLSVQGNGANGNNVIIQSDSGSPAIFTAPYWNSSQGAIYCSGKQYITFDGNGKGVIQNTADGSTLANHQISEGIEDDCSNSIIENWTVQNIYVHVTGNTSDCTGPNSCTDSECISVNNADQVLVTNNVVHDCRVGIGFNLPPSVAYSKWEVSLNTIYNIDHGVTLASNSTNTSIASVLEHDNDISNGSNWDSLYQSGNCDWHHDGTHIFAQGSASDTFNGVQIYNNYIHGVWTVTNGGSNAGCFNAHIYFEGDVISPAIFNNVLELDSGPLNAPDGGYVSVRAEGYGSGAQIMNNTFLINNAATSGASGTIQVVDEANTRLVNNLFSGTGSSSFGYFITMQNADTSCVAGYCDYNLYYHLANGYYWWQTNSFIDFATGSPSWQSSQLDTHGQFGVNPQLNSVPYTLQSGSPAIGAAKNLSELNLAALNSGAPTVFGVGGGTGNIVRPSSGAWDQGAYESSPGGQAPGAPTNLTAVVH